MKGDSKVMKKILRYTFNLAIIIPIFPLNMLVRRLMTNVINRTDLKNASDGYQINKFKYAPATV